MKFSNGRFVAFDETRKRILVLRFDENNSLVSGEIYLATGITSLNLDPSIPPLLEFFASLNSLSVFDDRLEAQATVSPDGEMITISRSGSFRMVCNRTEDERFLDFQFTDSDEREFIGRLKRRGSAFRKIILSIDRTPNAKKIGQATLNGRQITFVNCLKTAGISVITRERDKVTSNSNWSKPELENYLRSKIGRIPFLAWSFNLLITERYDDPDVNGYMFNDLRHGAAVFTDSIASEVKENDPDRKNKIQIRFIRTLIHEIGHCLNLDHSFERSDGEFDLSFMNYPHRFKPDGSNRYWKDFDFQFVDVEQRHLIHESFRNLIAGGRKFSVSHPEDARDFVENVPGRSRELALELRVRPKREKIPIFEFGEPVIVELKLRVRGKKRTIIRDRLSLDTHGVRIAITHPRGTVRWFVPEVRMLSENYRLRLDWKTRPSTYESVYLGYDANGFHFTEPGRYRIDAEFGHSGKPIRAEPMHLWVRYPDRATEDLVVPTFDEECGRFLAAEGGPQFRKAHGILRELQERSASEWAYGPHPLVQYYLAMDSIQKSREFKDAGRGQRWKVIQPSICYDTFADLIGINADGRSCSRRAMIPNFTYSRLCAALWQYLYRDGDETRARRIKSVAKKELMQTQRMKLYTMRDWNRSYFAK